jgi:hypothetical protein
VKSKSPLQKAASILGSVKSEKKAAAARANGAKTKKTLAARRRRGVKAAIKKFDEWQKGVLKERNRSEHNKLVKKEKK